MLGEASSSPKASISGRSSNGRASAFQAEGYGFEARRPLHGEELTFAVPNGPSKTVVNGNYKPMLLKR